MLKKIAFILFSIILTQTITAQSSCDTLNIVHIPDTLTVCNRDTIQFDSLKHFNHQWSNNTTQNFFIVMQEETIWVEIATPDNSCSRRDTIVVRFIPKPVLSNPMNIDTSLCFGDSLFLDASGQADIQGYLWNIPTDPGLAPTDSGVWVFCDAAKIPSAIYQYSVQMFGVCAYRHWTNYADYTLTDTAYIFFSLPPVVDLGIDSTYCPEEEFELTALDPSVYLSERYDIVWDDYSTENTLPVDSTNKGLHYVTVWNNCKDTVRDSVTIDFWPYAWTASKLIQDTSICEGVTIMLDASVPFPLTTYLWHHDSSRNPVIIVNVSRNYTVTLTDSAGCQKDFSANVSQDDCIPKIEFPNLFSPNGDGINDYFSPIVNERIENFEIRIFGRWGNTVYEYKGDPNNLRWDGKKNNKDVPDGVYFWVTKYKDVLGKKYDLQGFITILR